MASATTRAALDPAQAVALRRQMAAFGAEQVTTVHPIEPPWPAPTQGLAWQATLLEEPS
jgi:hypothetical protein